jgi:hypothetical protein
MGFFSPLPATAAPTGALLVKDASVVESDGSVAVRVVLAKRVNHKVKVSYRTIAKSARSNVDFVPVAGTLVFPAGTKARKVRVPIIDDARDESTERFKVRIYDAVGASIIDRTGKVSIFDDDPTPAVSVADVSVTEPDTGSTTMTFPVTLSAPSGRVTEVSWALTPGTATSGVDYVASASSGRLVFPAGATTGSISVSVIGDTSQEPTETLGVQLSSPLNLVILDGSATGSILDTDRPSLSVSNASVTEGGTATFTVSLSKASTTAVQFNYATIDGTALAASDYTSTSNSRTIPAGSTSTTIQVKTTEDTLDEADETYSLLLSSVTNATVTDGEGTGTIVDDDPTPTLSINNPAAVAEGSNVVFTVTLSAASGRTVTVNWATSNGDGVNGTDDAVAPGDYAAASATLTIPAGSTTGQITVGTVNDGTKENAEAFTVTLSSPVNAAITGAGADPVGIGTIQASD